MKRTWDAEEIRHLYYDQDKTLRDIAPIYGVSFERIRQVMKELGIPTNPSRHRNMPSKPQFTNLLDYLQHRKRTQIKDPLNPKIFFRLLPVEAQHCSECGSDRSILPHHIVYPATSLDDIQILCKSCHKIKHNGKMPYYKQLELYDDYLNGLKGKVMAKKFDISRATVAQIIYKLKHGLPVLKR